MEDNMEKLISDSSSVIEDSTPDYLTAIKKLKETTVDRSKYEELRAENKRLINEVLNGTQVEREVEKAKPSIQELREKLFNTEDQTNLEYITNALELRNALIESGEDDPFVPSGSQYNPTQADYERANRVATVLQEMVDASEGNPAIFRNEYEKRVKK